MRYESGGRLVTLNVPSRPAFVRLKASPLAERTSTHAPAAPPPVAGDPAFTVPLMVAPRTAVRSTPVVRRGAVTCTSRDKISPARTLEPIPHGSTSSSYTPE